MKISEMVAVILILNYQLCLEENSEKFAKESYTNFLLLHTFLLLQVMEKYYCYEKM